MSGFGYRPLNVEKTEPVRPVYEPREMAFTGCRASVIRRGLNFEFLRVKGIMSGIRHNVVGAGTGLGRQLAIEYPP